MRATQHVDSLPAVTFKPSKVGPGCSDAYLLYNLASNKLASVGMTSSADVDSWKALGGKVAQSEYIAPTGE